MTLWELSADLLMLAHAGCALFVVGGLACIVAGMILGWQWTRHRGFRLPHLAVTLFIVARAWLGIPCPFSAAEDTLRHRTNAICLLSDDFHQALHRLAFRGNDPHQFNLATTLFAAATLASFFLNRPVRLTTAPLASS